jgi:DNA transformation protein
MFGGAGIYRDDVMFALASDGEVFLKTEPATITEFEAAGSHPFTFQKEGKPVTTSYWSIPEAALDNSELVKRWADMAFQTALKSRKTKRKR